MKTLKLYTLLLLSVLFVFSSCSKDDDAKPQTKSELISAKTWKMSKIKEDGIDVTNEPEAAFYKNMRTKFNTDGTYNIMTTGFSDNGIWEFENNETMIVFDPNTDYEENWDITELKHGSLKVRSTFFYVDENGDVETALIEFEMIHA